MLFVEQDFQLGVSVPDLLANALIKRFQFFLRLAGACFGNGFTPLHLFDEKIRRQRMVVGQVKTTIEEAQQVLRPRQRFFQRLVGLVGTRCPLQRTALLCILRTGKAVRVHFCLDFTIALVKCGVVDPIATWQVEKREMIGVKVHFSVCGAGNNTRHRRQW